MSLTHELRLAVRVAALPMLGMLAVVSAVRDGAAKSRLRDDEEMAERAVSWDLLSPSDRAVVVDWTYGT